MNNGRQRIKQHRRMIARKGETRAAQKHLATAVVHSRFVAFDGFEDVVAVLRRQRWIG